MYDIINCIKKHTKILISPSPEQLLMGNDFVYKSFSWAPVNFNCDYGYESTSISIINKIMTDITFTYFIGDPMYDYLFTIDFKQSYINPTYLTMDQSKYKLYYNDKKVSSITLDGTYVIYAPVLFIY